MAIAQSLPLADSWGMHGDVGTGWMVLMMALMILFWGAIVLGIAWFIRGPTQRRAGPPESSGTRESPVEILERRFAEGSISPEDYRARRQVLGEGNAPSNRGSGDEPLTVR